MHVHENQHSTISEIKNGSPEATAKELADETRKEWQKIAFENPILDIEEHDEKMSTGIFHHPAKYTQNTSFGVILTVSPNDDNSGLFWACSVSIVYHDTGMPKKKMYWTRKEREKIEYLVNYFLKTVGYGSIEYKHSPHALHGHKDLSFEELQKIA